MFFGVPAALLSSVCLSVLHIQSLRIVVNWMHVTSCNMYDASMFKLFSLGYSLAAHLLHISSLYSDRVGNMLKA